MLFQLSAYGICASSGSACTSGSLEPSHVLRAMKVPFTAIHGSVRFSLSRYNTDEDIDTIIEVFPQIVANLRKLSPYWDNERNAPASGRAEPGAAKPRLIVWQIHRLCRCRDRMSNRRTSKFVILYSKFCGSHICQSGYWA